MVFWKAINRIREASKRSNSSQKSLQGHTDASLDDLDVGLKIAFGAGNFWEVEKVIRTEYEKLCPHVIRQTTVGFMSPYVEGVTEHPTYEDVCAGTSGHVEVVLIEFHESPCYRDFETLVQLYFSCHDPTTKYRQDQDRGFQYSSWVFCENDEQMDIVQRMRAELQEAIDAGAIPPEAYDGKRICTNVSPMHEFTPASEEHQEYLWKHPEEPCHHRIRFREWPNSEQYEPLDGKDEDREFESKMKRIDSDELLKRLRRTDRVRGFLRASLLVS